MLNGWLAAVGSAKRMPELVLADFQAVDVAAAAAGDRF
jgi:hypothetical protein